MVENAAGIRRKCMGMCWNTWECVGMLQNPWDCVGMRGNAVGLRWESGGNVWEYVGMRGNP